MENGDISVNRGALKVMGNKPQYSSSEIMIIEPSESSRIYRDFCPWFTHMSLNLGPFQ